MESGILQRPVGEIHRRGLSAEDTQVGIEQRGGSKVFAGAVGLDSR
jgi:hypothetical protein